MQPRLRKLEYVWLLTDKFKSHFSDGEQTFNKKSLAEKTSLALSRWHAQSEMPSVEAGSFLSIFLTLRKKNIKNMRFAAVKFALLFHSCAVVWLYQYLQFVTRFLLAETIFAIFMLQADELRQIGLSPSIAWLFLGFDPFDPV